jgi:hypothetical protein
MLVVDPGAFGLNRNGQLTSQPLKFHLESLGLLEEFRFLGCLLARLARRVAAEHGRSFL